MRVKLRIPPMVKHSSVQSRVARKLHQVISVGKAVRIEVHAAACAPSVPEAICRPNTPAMQGDIVWPLALKGNAVEARIRPGHPRTLIGIAAIDHPSLRHASLKCQTRPERALLARQN